MKKSPNLDRRILTVIEGRPENIKISEDFKTAAENRGWGFRRLDYINSDKLARFDLSDLPLDYVVFRNLTHNNYTEAERLLYYLKQNHKLVINGSVTGARATTSDKHFQQGLFLLDPFLKPYALPTYEAKNKPNIMSYINGKRVAFPIVLKYRYGTTGKNITLVKSETELSKIKDFNNLLIEQYIEPECDYRVFVIGGTAVGIMRKTGDKDHPEDFIAWSAGRSKSKEEDQGTIEILSKIACHAAAISGLEYTGVDIIKDAKTKKFYILETNFAAGWMNFIPVTKISIPDLVLDWFEERDAVKSQSIAKSIKLYIDRRKQYLPLETRELYDAILNGEKNVIKKVKPYFASEKSDFLYETGSIFQKLSAAHQDITENSADPWQYQALISEINKMPLSWAGNFIGPETGTLENGALLSAFYLFLLGKMKKVW